MLSMTMTKFYSGFDTHEPVVLVHGISLDNPKQNDAEYRQAFLKLVHTHHKRIAHCIELLGDELYTFYESEKPSHSLSKTWYQNHDNQFSTLWSWKQLSITDDYQQLVTSLEKEYKIDKAFKSIVDEFAKKHAHKKNEVAAHQYVIHECAGFLVLPSVIRQSLKISESTPIVVTYPSKEFNAAITYQLKKCKSELQYKGYHLHLPEKELLIKQCLKLKAELLNHNIIDEEQQTQFVSEVFKLIHHYQTKESNPHEKTQLQNGFFNQ